jgi:glutathione S-transferase
MTAPLTLHRPPPAWELRSLSPFAVKLEAYLRLAGLPYVAKGADPRRSPTGKVPYVRLADGTLLTDSQAIVAHLEAGLGAAALDAGLSAGEAARAHVVRRTLEEATYWHIVALRWHDDAGWPHTRTAFAGVLPPVVGPLALPLIRRQVRGSLWAQGTTRHAPAQRVAHALADFAAVEALADPVGPFFSGAAPRTVDGVVYAFVNAVLGFPGASPVKDGLRGMRRLCGVEAAVRARAFPEDRAPGGQPAALPG